jgi:hypothetical protein
LRVWLDYLSGYHVMHVTSAMTHVRYAPSTFQSWMIMFRKYSSASAIWFWLSYLAI